MSSVTPKFGLIKPAPSDAIDVTSQISNNYDILDSVIGTVICTSLTRPSQPYIGQTIRETDTGLHYVCTQVTPSIIWSLTTRCVTICSSSSRPTAPQMFPGLVIYETDTNLLYITYDGTTWTLYPRGIIVCTSITRPSAPVVGTMVYETDTSDFSVCLATTPSIIWVTMERAYIYGGKDITNTSIAQTTGNNATELLVGNNFDSGAMDLLPNTRYRIQCRFKATFAGTPPTGWLNTAAGYPTVFIARIRDTNLAGAIRAAKTFLAPPGVTEWDDEFSGTYETTAAESGKLWVMTIQRLTAGTSGSNTCSIVGAGTTQKTGIEVVNMGHSGQLTQVT